MQKRIQQAVELLDKLSQKKQIKIIAHYDADGITSAAIMARALQRWGKPFSLQIVKGIEKEYIDSITEDSVLIFLDLASNSLNYLKEKKTEILILDHHEIPSREIPKNTTIINPVLDNHEMLSASAITYLFAKAISQKNKDLANLAVIGMTGDILDKEINKAYDEILKDAETVIKKGLLVYPSTRPIDKTLEYCSSPYLPNITGSYSGVIELLREAGITRENGRYKSICELSEEEMKSLTTAIMLKGPKPPSEEKLIGNIYLVKNFNKLEDAREISALINACGRMDNSQIALGFCLGNVSYKQEAEKIYVGYKQHLVSALKYISEIEKIAGNNYTIINAKDKIKDTIIGTVASIISNSPVYKQGTIIIALAYNENKIKVSARAVGKQNRNLREVLHKVVVPLGGEVGGHHEAAGCLIEKDKEEIFIKELQKVLDIEIVKV